MTPKHFFLAALLGKSDLGDVDSSTEDCTTLWEAVCDIEEDPVCSLYLLVTPFYLTTRDNRYGWLRPQRSRSFQMSCMIQPLRHRFKGRISNPRLRIWGSVLASGYAHLGHAITTQRTDCGQGWYCKIVEHAARPSGIGASTAFF